MLLGVVFILYIEKNYTIEFKNNMYILAANLNIHKKIGKIRPSMCPETRYKHHYHSSVYFSSHLYVCNYNLQLLKS